LLLAIAIFDYFKLISWNLTFIRLVKRGADYTSNESILECETTRNNIDSNFKKFGNQLKEKRNIQFEIIDASVSIDQLLDTAFDVCKKYIASDNNQVFQK
jgi:hypothetical protein